jgi:DNA-binding response OmpR family regulator
VVTGEGRVGRVVIAGAGTLAADQGLADELASRLGLAAEHARLLAAAELATSERERLLAVVAHDLRNPLGAVAMYAEMLASLQPPEGDGDGGPADADRAAGGASREAAYTREYTRAAIATIHESAAGMQRLVEDLLDASSLRGGALRVHRTPARLGDAFAEAERMLAPLADRAGLALAIEAEGGAADRVAPVDAPRLVQLLSNLVGNAVKFTPPGGAWPCATGPTPTRWAPRCPTPARGSPPRTCRTCSPPSGAATGAAGAAWGSGCGSPAPSSRRTAASSRSTRARGAAPPSTSPSPSPTPFGGGRTDGPPPEGDRMHRILVVEDTPAYAEALERTLALEGHRVLLATRAQEALARARAEPPDLVVLDLGLPDKDGYHVLRELRARGAEYPVLILSGRSLEADKVEGFRLGADDYVTKPFGALELLARISALLRRARAAAPGAPAAGAPAGAVRVLDDAELRERYGLTDRQVTVARLIAEGCTNAELAARLGLSFFTVRNHAEQVMAKLGVGNRSAVAPLLHEPVGAGADG